ncbi:MAG: UDP-N-acetylmuramyl peptide synthase [Methanobrevibacter sp.]|jgi:UDP-N-acetylmuramyl tripeptide synthase|nr:UDP-N-acetylmuramyl peptide synthase [Methanobrevibacter sp.]
MNHNEITINSLAKSISGKIVGSKEFKSPEGFTGIFNILKDASPGDIVIRHWIDEKGVEIASGKNVACVITEDPRGNSIAIARERRFPLIVVDKIEEANAYALKWTIDKFAPNSKKVIISGTNGKSTTSHMIFHILNTMGANALTNTDSKSEFNTLIDPMIPKLISEEILYNNFNNSINNNINSNNSNSNNNKNNSNNQGNYEDNKGDNNENNNGDDGEGKDLEYLVIEASEVQGWLGKLMKDHAYLMTEAVDPDTAVITNIAMDHIGLVNSIEEVFQETSGVARALKKGTLVLNHDDAMVLSMDKFIDGKIAKFYFSMENFDKNRNIVDINTLNSNSNSNNFSLKYDSMEEAIIYNDEHMLNIKDLPFKSSHFIQNTLAAISACLSLEIPIPDIVKGVKSYKPLKRRFKKIHNNPIIIDDFAHNPEGIKATVNSVADLSKNKLKIICAIRGSRGEEINKINAEALAKIVNQINSNVIVNSNSNSINNNNNHIKSKINLILSSSCDVVDELNVVEDYEEKIFFDILNKEKVDYTHYENLYDAIFETYNKSNEDDVILLIGAQGMDPAENILKRIINNKT